MPTIKTYRKVGAFYIAWEADLSIPISDFNLSRHPSVGQCLPIGETLHWHGEGEVQNENLHIQYVPWSVDGLPSQAYDAVIYGLRLHRELRLLIFSRTQ